MLGAVVRDSNGLPESYITIFEDVTDRRREVERAAQIQRQLLPRATPHLRGYEVAGACLPARDVAGDFYDWMVSDDDILDFAVADVMGKGVGAGLVMATLRAGLRTAPRSVAPATRVQMAADSLVASDVGLFVTLFYAQLQVSTGRLSYVD